MYKYDIYLCCTDEVIICITGILTTNKHCIKQKGVCVCVADYVCEYGQSLVNVNCWPGHGLCWLTLSYKTAGDSF